MAKDVALSPEAQEYLTTQMNRLERHITAQAGVQAAEHNDDVVLPSHVETAYSNVLGMRSTRKQMGIVMIVSGLLGSAISGLFGSVGKSIGEWAFTLFR